MTTIKVRGLKEIEDQLKALGGKDGTRILRRATYQAANPIEERAKNNAGSIVGGSGALKQSITRRVSAGNKQSSFLPEMGSTFVVSVFPRAKNRVSIALHNLFYKRRIKGIFYGHLIEFGHKIITRSGQSKGTVPGRPIFLPALEAGATRAVAIFRREVQTGIERQIRRNAKNVKRNG